MHAMTIDALAGGGRVIIGLGVSGPADRRGLVRPAVGAAPTSASASTSTIMRKVLAARSRSPTTARRSRCRTRARVRSARASRCGRSCTRRADIAIWLAAGGPMNTELCRRARATAGCRWAGAPTAPTSTAAARAGFAKRGGRPEHFEVFGGVAVAHHRRRAARLDGHEARSPPCTSAAWAAATHNYHRDAMARRGFPEAADRIQRAVAGRAQGRGGRRGARRVPRAGRAARLPSSASASGGSTVRRPAA